MNLIKTNNKIGFPELRGSLAGMRYPAIVEPKLDGELNKLIVDKDEVYLINKYGTKREWNVDLPTGTILLGELVVKDGKAGELYELLKHKKDDNLKFIAFDILQDTGVDVRKRVLERRLEYLRDICIVNIHTVDIFPVQNEREAMGTYEMLVSQGYEGAVVKSLSSTYVEGPCSWVKIKHKDRNELPVVSIDPVKERMEVLHAGIRVGVKLPSKYKTTIKLGDLVTIEHQGVLASGSLRHPVYVAKEE